MPYGTPSTATEEILRKLDLDPDNLTHDGRLVLKIRSTDSDVVIDALNEVLNVLASDGRVDDEDDSGWEYEQDDGRNHRIDVVVAGALDESFEIREEHANDVAHAIAEEIQNNVSESWSVEIYEGVGEDWERITFLHSPDA